MDLLVCCYYFCLLGTKIAYIVYEVNKFMIKFRKTFDSFSPYS